MINLPLFKDIAPGLYKVCEPGCFAYPGDMKIHINVNVYPVPMPEVFIEAGKIILVVEKLLRGTLYLIIFEEALYTLVNVGVSLEELV